MLSRSRNVERPLLVGGGVAIFLSILGAVLSGDAGNWWWHLGTIGSALGLSFFFGELKDHHREIATRILTTISLTIILVAGFIYFAANTGLISLSRIDILTGGSSAIAAGVAFNALIVMVLLPKRSREVAIAGAVTLLIIGDIPILLFSILIYATVILLSITKNAQIRNGVYRFLTPVLILLGGLVYFLAINYEPMSIRGWGTSGFQLSLEERSNAYQVALEGFLEHPIVGNGSSVFSTYYQEATASLDTIPHPHSSFLTIIFEQGILGVLAIIFLVAGIILSKYPATRGVVLLVGFVAILAAFDSVFYHALIFYPLWISIGLAPRAIPSRAKSQSFLGDEINYAVHQKLIRRIHAIVDVSILTLGILVILKFIAMDSQTLFVDGAIITGVLAATWIAFQTVPRVLPGAQQFGFEIVFFPTSATILLAATLMILRVNFMVSDLVVFFAILQIGTGISRLALRHMVPNVDILLHGESKYFKELTLDPNLSIHTDAIAGGTYDYVVLGTLTQDPSTYDGQPNKSGKYVITDLQAIELLHGRVPPERLHEDWVDTVTKRVKRYLPLKRLLETVAILLFSPVIGVVAGIVALLVLISSGRPIIFAQTRVGRDNKPFRIYKFRTMKADAEADGAQFADSSDSRITPIGKLLRGFRLDEIPQFYNVLKGDMSIIGPRPEQQVFADEFASELPAYPLRHVVRPGITGWAQVNHGYAAGTDETLEKLTYDLFYIQHYSLWLDLHIAGKTISTILTRFGAK